MRSDNDRGNRTLELAATTALVLVLLAASFPAAGMSTARAQGSTCTPEERAQQLKSAQAKILNELLRPADGVDLTTLGGEGEADGTAGLAALAALGYNFYDHQQVGFEGQGWPVVDTLGDPEQGFAPTAGRPFVLLYAPTVPAPPATVTAPRDGFDFPYRLAGWAYSSGRYDFRRAPTVSELECVERSEWFVHERGIHPFEDGGMRPLPPEEELAGLTPHGTSLGQDMKPLATQLVPGDFPHGRIWDLHVWCSPDCVAPGSEVPSISISNPGEPIPGIDSGVGASPPPAWPDPPYPAFYYAPRVANLSMEQVDEPDPVRVGQRVTYTLTVKNAGPDRATGVTLTDVLPRNADGVSAIPSQGSCSQNKGTVTCKLGELAASGSATVQVTVRARRKGTIENTASVSANEQDLKGETDARNPVDPDDDVQLWSVGTADNSSTEATAVE